MRFYTLPLCWVPALAALAFQRTTSAKTDDCRLFEKTNFSFAVERIPGSFPVEVTGIDCGRLTKEQEVILKKLLAQHKLLVIRNQYLTEAEQVKFTTVFGEPDIAWDNRNRSGKHPEVQVISNQSAEGPAYLYNRKKKSSVRFWHTDTSFLPKPTRYTFLHAKVLPSTGGDTKFINTKLAYDALPEKVKAQIQKKQAIHSFNYFFGQLLKERGHTRTDKLDDVTHPLVIEVDGERALYLSKLALAHIEGMTEEEEDKLLTQLYEHCKKTEYRYRHVWKKGDLLVWDNFFTMHKGTFADPQEERTLSRTTVRVS